MQTYISLLRGINVSGQKSIKMDDLKAHFESLGFQQVKTYIQSGNVVFNSVRKDTEGLEQTLMDSIAKEFGFEVPVIVRNSQTIGEILKNNPFLSSGNIDSSRMYVTFLSGIPDDEAVKTLSGMETGDDKFEIVGKEVYLSLPGGYARTKLSNNTFERKLGLKATTRNWRTVNKLQELALEARNQAGN